MVGWTVSIAQAIDLVQNRQAVCVIVIPDRALPVVQSAAEELQYHIQKSTDAVLPIISEAKAQAGGSKIYLGPTRKARELKLSAASLPPNGFIIKLVSGDLFMLGDDSEGPVFGFQHGNRTRVGTLFAVYEFLDKHLGVRWLWPGELGEVIPKRQTISVDKWDQVGKPFLIHSRWRDASVFSDGPGWMSQANQQRFAADQGKWLRRNRFALGVNMDITHAFTDYWDRYGKTHPDFFNLLPDGTRRSDPYYCGAAPSLISMCVSNPALWQAIIDNPQHVRNKSPLVLDISENDTSGKCTCPKCLAWDVPDPECKDWDHRLQKATEAFKKGTPGWEDALGSLSDRYAKFLLAVQKEAEKIDPNVVVMDHAYANHEKPPRATKLNDRVMLAIVPSMMYPCSSKAIAAFRAQWSGWRAAGASLMLRPNYTLSGHDFPLFYARKVGEDFRFAARRGLIGTDYDSLTGQYAAQGPTLYMIARSNNRPDLSVDQVLDEYYQAFGPAKEPIRAYFNHWEKISDSLPNGLASQIFTDFNPTGGHWAAFYVIAPALFTPDAMAQGRKLLAQAQAAAKADPLAAQRVAFLELGLKQAELTLAVQMEYRTFKATGDLFGFAKAIKALDEFRTHHETSNFSNRTPLLYTENLTWNRSLVELMSKPGRPLDKTWKFNWDPNRIGETAGWFQNEFPDAAWSDIGVDDVWQNQPVGKAWEATHKTPYHGVAWYRTTFCAEAGQRQYRLIFGAVDKGCTVWVNGKKLLHRPWPMPGNPNSWQEAFEVNVSSVLRTDRPNVLAVCVESTSGVGGIYRGVWLAASDPPAQSGNLIRNGGFETGVTDWQYSTMTGEFEFKNDSTQSYHEKHSARITCTRELKGIDPSTQTTSWGRWYQTVSVQPEKTYQLKLKAKTSLGYTGTIKVWVTGTKSGMLESHLLNTNGLWWEIVITDIHPASRDIAVYLNVFNGIGTVWFDDVELSPL
jgi:hypothetical protein